MAPPHSYRQMNRLTDRHAHRPGGPRHALTYAWSQPGDTYKHTRSHTPTQSHMWPHPHAHGYIHINHKRQATTHIHTSGQCTHSLLIWERLGETEAKGGMNVLLGLAEPQLSSSGQPAASSPRPAHTDISFSLPHPFQGVSGHLRPLLSPCKPKI